VDREHRVGETLPERGGGRETGRASAAAAATARTPAGAPTARVGDGGVHRSVPALDAKETRRARAAATRARTSGSSAPSQL
jgi:hypothetical protein